MFSLSFILFRNVLNAEYLPHWKWRQAQCCRIPDALITSGISLKQFYLNTQMNKSEMSFVSKLLLLSFFNLVRTRENVTYSYTLWIGHDKHITAYSMQQTSPSGITFFDAMIQAKDSGNTFYDFDSGSAPYFSTSITKISGIDSNWYVMQNWSPEINASFFLGIRDGYSTK